MAPASIIDSADKRSRESGFLRSIQVHPGDNVAVALADLTTETVIDVAGRAVALVDPVPRGHKVALCRIAAGEPVLKFGSPIGRATTDIAMGAYVHTHNLATMLTGEEDYCYRPHFGPVPIGSDARFAGYVRADGRVATRNEIWVLPTVGCVARTAQKIAAAGSHLAAGLVDGVHAFTHPFGCSQLSGDLEGTRRILAALACHPNAGGVVLVGLGCESNQLDALLDLIPAARRSLVRAVRAQSSADEIADGARAVADLAQQAAAARRVGVGLNRLVLGLKCGGSDGLSGLTANPLVGRMADRVVGAGGTAILTEIPEIFGAEQLLMNCARDAATFDRVVTLVNGFKRYYIDHGEPVSENPSPGNLAGGITTLEEKSLGAVQKGGSGLIEDVLGYGEQFRLSGLNLLEAPGNDAVSSTALAAAGATVILFTTGRGTPLGFPVPTIKIASNSNLAMHKAGWIDFDAGHVLDRGMDAAEDALSASTVAIASGRPTAAERNGEREIAIWKRGVTL